VPVRGSHSRVELPWPGAVPEGGRHGVLRSDLPAFAAAVRAAGQEVLSRLDPDRPIVVIAHEEFMYLPLLLAQELRVAGVPVLYQTTTRSPAYVLDEPDYPLRRGFRFIAPEQSEDEPRYLYNAAWPTPASGSPSGTALLLLVVDPPADTARLTDLGGLVDVLTAAGSDVLIAVLPGADPVALERNRTLEESQR
jgi:hypothetical protein